MIFLFYSYKHDKKHPFSSTHDSDYTNVSCYNVEKGDVINMSQYQHLFSPINIGNTTVKNRVFMPPISTNLANKGYVTDELIKHYELVQRVVLV